MSDANEVIMNAFRNDIEQTVKILVGQRSLREKQVFFEDRFLGANNVVWTQAQYVCKSGAAASPAELHATVGLLADCRMTGLLCTGHEVRDFVREVYGTYSMNMLMGMVHSVQAAACVIQGFTDRTDAEEAARFYQEAFQPFRDPTLGEEVVNEIMRRLTRSGFSEPAAETWVLLDGGYPVKFVLEWVPGVEGRLLPDPIRLGLTCLDEEFLRTIAEAWGFVKGFYGCPSNESQALWWLKDLRGISLIRGSSAGAALALAAKAAFKGVRLDPGMAISATLTGSGVIGSVTGEARKCQAAGKVYCREVLFHSESYARVRPGWPESVLTQPVEVDTFDNAWGRMTECKQSDAFDFSRLPDTRPRVFGRDEQLCLLDKAWENPGTPLVVFHAFGGVGKTAMVKRWKETLCEKVWGGAQQGFGYSFYRQGEEVSGRVTSRPFFEIALRLFGDPNPSEGDESLRLEKLLRLVTAKRTLLIIDGLEAIQKPPGGDMASEIVDQHLRRFLIQLYDHPRFQGLCVVTTRYCPPEMKNLPDSDRFVKKLERLDTAAGRELVKELGVQDNDQAEIDALVEEYEGYALALVLVASYLKEFFAGDPRKRGQIPAIPDTRDGCHARRVLAAYEKDLRNQGRETELWILNILGLFDRLATQDCVTMLQQASIPGLPIPPESLIPNRWHVAIERLRQYNLIEGESSDAPTELNVHPLVREFFREKLRKENWRAWQSGNFLLHKHFKRAAPRTLSSLPRDDYYDDVVCLLRAIHHACLAGRYWDAFTLLTCRVDETYKSVLGEWGFRWLLLSAWRCLDRTPVTRWLRAAIVKLLGRCGVGPLAPFYRSTTELDKPVGFYLANELEEWNFRLNAAEEFYPHGFASRSALNDTFLSLVMDVSTSQCLTYLGRNEDAIVTSERAYIGFKALNVKPLVYLLASGIAIIHLHLGNLRKALHYAEEASALAANSQQVTDTLCTRGTIRAYSGDSRGAQEDFERCATGNVPSTRLVGKYWEFLIRYCSLKDLEKLLPDTDQRFGPEDHRNLDQFRTVLILLGRMNLAYRKTVEQGSPTPSELIEQNLHAYDKVPNCYTRSWFHLTCRAFYIGRAASLLAAESKNSKDIEDAYSQLRNAERLARSGGYQLLLIDILVMRSRLSLALGRVEDAKAEATRAHKDAADRLYTWGRDDAAAVLQMLEERGQLEWQDIFCCAAWKRCSQLNI